MTSNYKKSEDEHFCSGLKTENERLNIYKTIAMIFIVLLHCPFNSTIDVALSAVARVGTPLFFLIAGYYYSSGSNWTNKTKNAILRTIRMIILMEILSAIYHMSSSSITDIAGGWTKYFRTPTGVLFLAIGVIGTYGAGWFIYSLLYCYILFYAVRKYRLEHAAYLLGCFLLFLHFILNYSLFREADYSYGTSNFWMMGLPFFCLGYYLNSSSFDLSDSLCRILLVIGLAESVVSACFIQTDLYLGTVACVIGIILYSRSKPQINNGIIRRFSRLGRITGYVYVTHLYVIQLLKNSNIQNEFVFGALAVTISYGIGIFIYKSIGKS